MGFFRQEYWSGLPFPSPGHLPNPGTKPRSPALQADSLPSEPQGIPCLKAPIISLSHDLYVTPKLMETPSSLSSWTLPSSHHVRHASYPSDQWLATIFCKESYSKYFRVSGCMVSFIIIQLCYCRTKSFIRSNVNEWVWLYFKKSCKIHIFIYDCAGSSLLLEGFL